MTRQNRRLAQMVAACALSCGAAGTLPGQGGGAADTTADSSAVRRLGAVRVSVSRTEQTAQRVPWAVGVLDKVDLMRGQATIGIDEALNNIPGVYVANRYNYSVDQRLSIRGAGARANFGIRGVKVLLDGVPQSLPDGQNQMTNVDIAGISRVEVLRGAASSLYGNGSGGVIAFSTDLSSPERLGTSIRVTSGSYGLNKVQVRAAGRSDRGVASLSASRTVLDGFRQFDTVSIRQVNGAADWLLHPGAALELRASYADMPTARNPGALTLAEYRRNPDSASATNINRGANKSLSQAQFSVRFRHADDFADLAAVAYVLRRFVDNPLATAPPGTTGATIGTYSTLNRWVTGARLDGARRIGRGERAPRLAAGVDLQRSFDIRRNSRATAGKVSTPTDTIFVDQGESVIALGPFATVTWSPLAPLSLSAGARWDRLAFDVHDHFLGDGVNNSASRDMTASTGHLGASWVFRDELSAYANFATAFETPTTTELSNRPDGAGGFNADLGPQRIRSIEAGIRGTLGGTTTYTVSAFKADVSDAIIQYLESNGRAYFRNVGKTRRLGLEVGAQAQLAPWVSASVALTRADYRFVEYRAQNRAVIDTLDTRREAGVPGVFVRWGLKANWRGATLEADNTWSSALYGDDKNTIKVHDWGNGTLNVRLAWSGSVGTVRVEPFAAVNNAFNQAYVGSVTLNGAFGRVFEPAPLRNFHFGLATGWPVVR